MNLTEASRKRVDEISNNLKRSYLKQAIEQLEWFAGANEYVGLSVEDEKVWEKRRNAVMKLVDKLTSKK